LQALIDEVNAFRAANAQIALSTTAQTNYTNAGGEITDVVYTDVTDAKNTLNVWLFAYMPGGSLTNIIDATADLTTKTGLLDDATAVLEAEAVLLAAAESAVAALELAAAEDLTIQGNLEAAEALVTPAQDAVTAAVGITGIAAIEGRLTTAETTVTDARTAFDEAVLLVAEALATALAAAEVSLTGATSAKAVYLVAGSGADAAYLAVVAAE